MTPDERRAYNRTWMERYRRSRGVLPWSEHPKKVKPPRPPKRTPEEARIAAKERYARLRGELIEYQKRWMKANPERVRVSKNLSRRQRDARKRATRNGDVSYRRILKRDGYWCGICGVMIIGASLSEIHFDHIVPLSRGGAHVEDNIQVSHSICNMRKHNSLGP